MWTASIGRVYGIRPWEMQRVSSREIGLMRADLTEQARDVESAPGPALAGPSSRAEAVAAYRAAGGD